MNRGRNEEFWLYTTRNRNWGLSKGTDYIALKSVSAGKFVTVAGDEWIECNIDRPGNWEKWGGWTNKVSWNIEKVEFGLSNGRA